MHLFVHSVIVYLAMAPAYPCAFYERAKVEQGSDRDQNQIQTGSLFVESDRQGNENLLRTLLIHNGIYDRRHHPVFDGDVLNVSMSLALLNLIQIDEFKGTISVTAEMAFKWFDQHISWEPSRFANISVLPVSDTDIYHPDVLLTNALFHTDQRPFASSMALLHSSGKVLWFPRATLKTRCQVDPLLWPYTALQCDFKFGVPVHDTRVRLLLRSKHIFVKLYAPHHSWTVIKASQFIMNASNTDLQERYGTEELPWFRLHLRKTPSTFGTSVLIAPLVVLILNGFLVMHNWNSDAHYIACAFSLIFFGGLHAFTSVWIPPSPTLPWFSLFLALSSMLVLFTLFSLPLLAHFHPRNHQQLALPRVVLVLAKLLTRPFAALGSMGGLREGTSKYSDFSSTMKSHNVLVSNAVRSCIALVYWTSAVCISLLTLRHFYKIENADSEDPN